jgi:hypothetical protein
MKKYIYRYCLQPTYATLFCERIIMENRKYVLILLMQSYICDKMLINDKQ